jgi:Domain of unknown function (DUF1987).
MENLVIEKGPRTPGVDFNVNGELRIEGRSTPENAVEFYEVLINWVKEFKKKKPTVLNLHVNFEFFNTSSSKLLITIFKQIEKFKSDGFEPNIFWYYDESDEDMFQSGKDYQSILKIPFHIMQN